MEKRSLKLLSIIVSMPSIGQIPFLLYKFRGWVVPHKGCVNALNRANPISTKQNTATRLQSLRLCQCPQSGKSHFYSEPLQRKEKKMNLCQCPQSGKSHFYRWKVHKKEEKCSFVSMPSIGQIPFLHALRITTWTIDIVCQCPQSGKSHFYAESGWDYTGTNRRVSMPSIGQIPFLRPETDLLFTYLWCVNALNRANPISTLPLWNRLI